MQNASNRRVLAFRASVPPIKPKYIIETEVVYSKSLKIPIILNRLKRIDPR